MNNMDLAYLAGILDGEGCIGIAKRTIKNKGYAYPRYTLRVEVQMSDHATMAYLSDTFSRPIMAYRPAQGKRMAYRISWQADLAKGILESVLPYLHGKKAQAEIGIAFQTTCSRPTTGYRLSIAELQMREEAYLKIRVLKLPTELGKLGC